MRCCLASPARALTLISLALVTTQSLLFANAQSDSGIPTDIPGIGDGDGGAGASPSSTSDAAPSTTSISTSSDSGSSTSSSHGSSSQPHSSSVRVSSSTTAPLPASTSSNTPVAAVSSSSSLSSSSSSAGSSSSTSTSSSSSSSASSSSVSSSSSSTSSSSSASSSSTGITLVSNTGTTAVASPTTHAAVGPDTTSYSWLTTSSAGPTEVAAAKTSSSSSFFDNKGAVAGVFSVVGVVALGGIITAVVLAKRRAARLQDEEDMAYFEKYPSPSAADGAGPRSASPTSFTGGYDTADGGHDAPLAHAAADAYPDRATHFGLPTMEEYSQPQPMMDFSFNNGIEYPPGMAYDPSGMAGMAYNPQQYAGYQGGYGTGEAGVQQDAYYQQPSRSPTHPYADPSNAPRVAGAPPVQHYGQPGEDAYYGEAR